MGIISKYGILKYQGIPDVQYKKSGFMIKQRFFLLFFFTLMLSFSVYSQVEIEKSEVTKMIDGRMYYLHLVEPGQTLYSISRAYGIPQDEIIFENPEAESGLNAYQNLRIPAVSRDVQIAQKIRSERYDYVLHIVSRGETLYSISRRYNITLDQLKEANPGLTSDLKVGQYIQVPAMEVQKEIELPDNAIAHSVQPGETFYSLSQEYQVPIESIKVLNPGVDYPVAGNIIYVPSPEPQKVEKKVESDFYLHKVRQGETLYGLARRFMVPIDSIRSANPEVIDKISIGQELKIPLPDSEKQFIEHKVDERKTRLRSIAKMYGADVGLVKDINPRLGRRVYYNQTVKIPVAGDAEIPEPEMVTVIEEKPPADFLPERPPDAACKPSEYSGRTCKVALMLPLYLEEVKEAGSEFFEDPDPGTNYEPFRFISFYQGAMLAIDSLSSLGLNVEVFLYDVDRDISKTIKVLQDTKLQEVDLIIGPLFRTNFKYVSNFARIFGIKIINPFTKSKEVIEQNSLAFKMMPSESEGIYQAAELIRKKFSDYRIILVRGNKYQNTGELNELRSILIESVEPSFTMNNALLGGILTDEYMPPSPDEEFELPETGYAEGRPLSMAALQNNPGSSTTFINDLPEVIYASDSLGGIVEKASVLRPNLVIAFADSEVFALELMTAVNEVKDSLNITLFGLPDWQSFTNLETQYLLNFNTHMLSPSYIDYSSSETKDFVSAYRERYLDEPSSFAFTGYDAAFYFLSAFMKYGPDFENCIHHHKEEFLRTKYVFRKLPGRGYENVYWNLLRYGDYEIVPIPNESPYTGL